jgi:phytoene synthase
MMHDSGAVGLFAESDSALSWAYRYCEELTAWHSRSFSLASRLLPPEKRRAVRALYAFCRTTDDIVDRPQGDVTEGLQSWRQRALTARPEPHDLVPLAWADARRRFLVPPAYAEQLIDGVARDLTQRRYQTFSELAEYSYGVASTVGLMSAHIIGFESDEALPYAIRLGVALQLTNILRDIGEDWAVGRLYLPLDELQAFDLSPADVARGLVTDRWRAFMRFQIARNRRLYREAWPGIAMLSKDGQMAIATAATLYAGILDDIEAHDYDVFSRRAHLGAWGKLRRLPGVWWNVRRNRARPG